MSSYQPTFLEITYKQWYEDAQAKADRYWDQYRNTSSRAASLTGYLSGMAKYNRSIPNQDRIHILNMLIEMYDNSQDSLDQSWVDEWKKAKADLEK